VTTPSDTARDPLRDASRDTVLRRIEAAAAGDGSLTLVGSAAGAGPGVEGPAAGNGDPADRILRIPWRELHGAARGVAGALQARGVRPGDHVALLGPTSPAFVTAVQAVYLCGAAAVVLPLPMRLGSLEDFVAQTEVRIDHSDAVVVLVDHDLADFLPTRAGSAPLVLLDELVPQPDLYRRPADDPDALAVLQYTSGSTADPKGVMLPHRCVLSNIDAMCEAAAIRADDVMLSWLPLYHDMGLIGFLTLPMTTGTDLVLAAPQDFLGAPARWVTWMSRHGGTVTAGPNFSYALAARALRRLEDLDLRRWRIALNGAEPVDPDTVDAFLAAGERHGLSPGVVFGAYGMAEATLAITFPEPGTGMTYDYVERQVLELERYAAPARHRESTPERPVRRLARLGTPIPGFELRVCDPETGFELAEREVGEIELRGPSITPGYYRHPEATASSFRGEWLRTGDLGYWADGEVVVCGRMKDLIIVGGRNVFPEDVERAVADVDGVRTGNVIAFGTEGRRGREALVVVAEVKGDDTEFIRSQIRKRVADTVGIPPQEVVLVAAGTLPKTSSGKLQRSLCREQFLDHGLASLG
jgi:fatty-acyl-CoA synthase